MRGRDMTGNHPVVVELDDGLHVADGHHRIVAAWLDGAEDIEARYKDLRAVSSALKAMSIDAAIVKVDDEQRTVWGWASVIAEDGKPVVDRQGDIITEADLIAAAHDFMLNARQAKAMHEGDRVGDVVESMVLTEDRAKALGIPGGGKVGWLIAMKIHDDAVWKRVKAGELRAFSIGGRGKRREV
jgi:hypothetical protein